MSLIVVPPPSRAITVNSTGAGNRNGTAGSPISTTFTHVVADGSNRRMYAFVAISHNNWLNSYSSVSASSSLDGAFALIGSHVLFGNASGYRQGGVALFELINPSVGSHTITLTVSASQWLSLVGGNTRCYNNVGGRGTPVTQALTTSNGALNASLTSNYGDMALLISAFSESPTFGAGQPIPWYADGSSVNGDADYLRGLDRPGGGASFNFASTSAGHKVGAIGINLIKA